MYIRLG